MQEVRERVPQVEGKAYAVLQAGKNWVLETK